MPKYILDANTVLYCGHRSTGQHGKRCCAGSGSGPIYRQRQRGGPGACTGGFTRRKWCSAGGCAGEVLKPFLPGLLAPITRNERLLPCSLRDLSVTLHHSCRLQRCKALLLSVLVFVLLGTIVLTLAAVPFVDCRAGWLPAVNVQGIAQSLTGGQATATSQAFAQAYAQVCLWFPVVAPHRQ